MGQVIIENLKFSLKRDELYHSIIDIDKFTIEKGDAVFIIGRNGSGKSTLLKQIFSPLRKDQYARFDKNNPSLNIFSNINLLDYNYPNINHHRESSFVYIPQESNYNNQVRVYEVLRGPIDGVNKKRKTVDNHKIDQLVWEYIKEYLLDVYDPTITLKNFSNEEKEKIIKEFKKKRINDCSGGQKKLISLIAGFIRVELLNIPLLVLDEPLNFLDPGNLNKVEMLITKLKYNLGLTLIIVSHLLTFEFISDSTSKQYYLKDNKLKLIKEDKKIKHNISMGDGDIYE